MAIVTDNYYLSLTQDNRVLRVRCSQGDSSRNINLILYNNGSVFTIPSGVSASVRGVRQDGSIFSKSCSIMSNRTGVVLTLNSAINGVAGIAVAEIVLTDGGGNKVGTSNFIIQVESNLLLRGTVEVGEESPVEYISDLIDVVDALNARVNNIISPSGEASLSEVVDARLSGYSGTTYQNLKARIDADFAALNNAKADKSNTYTKEEVDEVNGRLDKNVSDLKSALDYYLNGVDASYPITAEGSKRIEFSFLKDAIYTITNSTDNNCLNLRVYKKDGTTSVIDSTFAMNESVSYVPATDDIVAFGGYFDGTGTVSVKCDYKGLQVDITPEMFGAVGDGSTNDKTALQNAIDYCIAHNQPLFFNAKSHYAVGDQIMIVDPPSNFHIWGNGASIVALAGYSLSANKFCIYITQTGTRYADMTYLENIKIDCNNVCAGLQVDHGYDFTFENINVRNCKTVAINCLSGGECYFNNIAIHCVHNSGDSTGLQIQSSDYHFTDVVIIDADRAIYNASSSMYTRVHAWNTSGCADTYYFVHNAGYPILVQCHADTYETAYYRETDRPIMLIGCVYYINSNLYDSSATPVVFKFTSNSIGYSGNIKCVNCIFDALRTEVKMTESVHKIQMVNCSKKGTINLYDNGTSINLSNGTTDTGLSVNANRITQEADYLHYYFILNLTDVDLIGTNAKTIGTISNTRFRPKTFLVYPCMFVTDEYATNVISGYITINNNNGVVQVKPNSAGTYKKLIADFREYRPLSLYEN